MEREGIAHPELGRVPDQGLHDAALVAGRARRRRLRPLITVSCTASPPRVEELARPGHTIEPVRTLLDPVQLLEPLHHVVGSARGSPPRPAPARPAARPRSRSTRRAARRGRPGRARTGLERAADSSPVLGRPSLLDQDTVEREVAVARPGPDSRSYCAGPAPPTGGHVTARRRSDRRAGRCGRRLAESGDGPLGRYRGSP